MKKILILLLISACTAVRGSDVVIGSLSDTITWQGSGTDWYAVFGGGAAPVSYWNNPYTNNLLAMYYLDDLQPSNSITGYGTTYADTKIEGTPYWKNDLGYYFNGAESITNRAVMDLIPAAFSNVSLSVWFRPDSTSGHGGIIGIETLNTKLSPLGIAYPGNGTIRTMVDGAYQDNATVLSTNVLTHLTYTYDGLVARLYTNGAPFATQTKSAIISKVDASRLSIGRYYNTLKVAGTWKDARMYARTLTSDEAMDLYLDGFATPAINNISTNDLVVAYQFLEDNTSFHSDCPNRSMMWPDPSLVNCPQRIVISTNEYQDVLYGYEFDGGDDAIYNMWNKAYMDKGSESKLTLGTNDFAISVWYKNDTINDSEMSIFGSAFESSSGDYGLFIRGRQGGTNLVWVVENASDIRDTNVISDAGMVTGIWTHVMVSREFGGEMAMWVNGIKQSHISTNTTDISIPIGTTKRFQFGTFALTPFDGIMYDYSVYDFAATNAMEIYLNTNPTNYLGARIEGSR